MGSDTTSISTTMASEGSFMVSAPGKVIVFGEHAVVYGKAAMAASISLRSYLHVQRGAPSSDPTISLNLLDISLAHSWRVSSLPLTTFGPDNSKIPGTIPSTLSSSLVDSLAPHLDAISPSLDHKNRKVHLAAASTFLYLYLLLPPPATHDLTFTLRSTIPIGAGLGSSASISVCLSTALLHLAGHLPLPSLTTSPTSSTHATINALAFLGESIIHGTPSGVDNTVATLGKAVVFRRALTPGTKPRIDPIARFPELPLLVVDTKQEKSTETEVRLVRELMGRHPVVVGGIMDAIDAVTEEARGVIAGAQGGEQRGEEAEQDGAGLVERLGELVRLNHGLLFALGKSHPRLEELRDLVDRTGVGWFKLTGAGGGGCGFVLLVSEIGEVLKGGGGEEQMERLRKVERELEKRHFERYETILGGDGVGIRLSRGQGEIGLDEFINAKGTKDVETLCGGGQPGWQYWRS